MQLPKKCTFYVEGSEKDYDFMWEEVNSKFYNKIEMSTDREYNDQLIDYIRNSDVNDIEYRGIGE
ncbi:hypothetical protein EHP00_1126 [Ecytonucleospora hepatopenaei]|uniref:Uncharacterized protein n=1 Tax=Ecytonucleospora hepatopenaei TaxID=646526 RepID=A0A1W0E4Y3_9MICR|nr:hypothetical protein EHP00_1126 [Ecytonucleospora hepatopenaei]